MFFNKPFEPNQLPGCQLWLDSQDSRTLTFSSSNIVSQWNDKSGNNRHVSQATVSAQPTWNIATGLTFDGVNDALFGEGIPGTDYSFFIVYKMITTGGTRSMFSTGTGSDGISCRMNSDRNLVHSGVAVVFSLGNFSTTDFEIMGGRRNASSAFSHLNGGNYGTYSGGINGVTAPLNDKLGVGCRSTTSEFCNVQVKEIVYYDRQISLDEAGLIQRYLSFKHGINILSVNTALNNITFWIKGGNLTANGAVTDPDGGSLAYSFTSNAATASNLYQTVSLVPNTKYKISQRVKSSSSTPFFFQYSEWNGSSFVNFTSTPVSTSGTWQTFEWEFETVNPVSNLSQIHVIPPDRANGSEFSIYKPVLTRLT